MCYGQGVDLRTVQHWLGHSDMHVNDTNHKPYSHIQISIVRLVLLARLQKRT
jgi:site-specific recombinase XerD